MLDIFQDIVELHKIIFFQTGESVEDMAKKLQYSRPHLTLLLKGKGSKAVTNELIEKMKVCYKKEVLQFVSKYGKVEATEDSNFAEIQEELKVIAETQVALVEIVLAFVAEKKSVYNKSVEILKKHRLEGIFL